MAGVENLVFRIMMRGADALARRMSGLTKETKKFGRAWQKVPNKKNIKIDVKETITKGVQFSAPAKQATNLSHVGRKAPMLQAAGYRPHQGVLKMGAPGGFKGLPKGFSGKLGAATKGLKGVSVAAGNATAGLGAMGARMAAMGGPAGIIAALTAALGLLAVAISVKVAGAMKSLMETFGKLGGDIVVAKQVFEKLRHEFDGTSLTLEKLRHATMGTISDFELMKGANYAITAGIKVTEDKYADLMHAAVKLGKITGRDTTEAMQRLTNGIIKQERRIVDELGIVIKAKDVFKEYADAHGLVADKLDASQKVQAFLESTMDGAISKVAKFNDMNWDAANVGDKFAAVLENMKNSFAELFVESGMAEEIMSQFVATFNELKGYMSQPGKMNEIWNTMKTALEAAFNILKGVAAIFINMLPTIEMIVSAFSYMTKGINTVTEALGGMSNIAGVAMAVLSPLVGVVKGIGWALDKAGIWSSGSSPNIGASQSLQAARQQEAYIIDQTKYQNNSVQQMGSDYGVPSTIIGGGVTAGGY